MAQRTAGAVQGLSYLDIPKCHTRLLLIFWKCVVTDDTGKEVWQIFLFCFNIFNMFVFLLSLKLFFFEKHLLLVGEKCRQLRYLEEFYPTLVLI